MSKVSTNISISPKLKQEAASLFKDLGLDLSTAVNMFLAQAVKQKGFPFAITTDIPDDDTLVTLKEIKEMKMSRKISVNLSLGSEVKQNAIKLFNKLGISLSTAITLFLQQAVLEQGIPFYVTREVPNEETLKALAEYEEMKNNPEKYKRYSSFKEILEELHDEENHKK